MRDSANFSCSAEGYGPFKFGWMQNNNETRLLDAVLSFSNKTFIYSSDLLFKNLTRSDNGSFSCHVDNQIISTIYLSVPSMSVYLIINHLIFYIFLS